MARELTLLVGVLAEKRAGTTRWAKDYWIPVGVMPQPAGLKEGDVLVEGDGYVRYFMGVHAITCHAAETEAYVHNFNARVPAIYIALRRTEEGGHPLPWHVHAVTVSPYEAQDFEDSAEDIVERVAMPSEIERAVKDFVEHYHTEEDFKKRRRDKLRVEDHKFGKEPIFHERTRPPGGKLDG